MRRVPSTLPPGEPAPADGALPATARTTVGQRPLSIYLHVPFCTTRCGYCDFNTYTATELGTEPGASQAGYIDTALARARPRRRRARSRRRPVSTIFVGGGTPTLLPPDDLGRMVAAVEDRFGLTADAEITTESNPESIDAAGLDRLRALGFTRISFGMQSAVPHVLARARPGALAGPPAAGRRRGQGGRLRAHQPRPDLRHARGSRSPTGQASLDAAIAAEPDHLSAYALIVEEGTRLAARIRRGELPMTDDDDLADKYLIAEERLTAAGFAAYEVSNWARGAESECRHNLAYWRSDNWWGIGPGAHSHVGGVRWWNVKHPQAYAKRLADGLSPAYAREVLDPARSAGRAGDARAPARRGAGRLGAHRDRTGTGCPTWWSAAWRSRDGQQLILTLQGRLLADGVIRELLD